MIAVFRAQVGFTIASTLFPVATVRGVSQVVGNFPESLGQGLDKQASLLSKYL